MPFRDMAFPCIAIDKDQQKLERNLTISSSEIYSDESMFLVQAKHYAFGGCSIAKPSEDGVRAITNRSRRFGVKMSVRSGTESTRCLHICEHNQATSKGRAAAESGHKVSRHEPRSTGVMGRTLTI
jgi:hypothetical protein